MNRATNRWPATGRWFSTASLASFVCFANPVVAEEGRDPVSRSNSQLELIPDVVEWGDPLVADVTVFHVGAYSLGVCDPLVERLSCSGTIHSTRPPGALSVHGWSANVRHTLAPEDYPSPRGFYDDPTRHYLEISLHETTGRGLRRLVETRRAFLLRPYRTLSLPEVEIEILHPLVPNRLWYEAKVEPPDERGRRSFIELVRLGRYLPGGAVEVDHRFNSTANIRPHLEEGLVHLGTAPLPSYLRDLDLLDPDVLDPKPRVGLAGRLSSEAPSARDRYSVYTPTDLGPWEIRYVGPGGGLVAREAFSVRLPDASNALRLVPEIAGAYPLDGLPAVEVNLPAELDSSPQRDWATLSLYRIGRAGVRRLAYAGALSIADSEGRFQLGGVADPGTYEVVLALSSGWSLLLDSATFEVGGDLPTWYTPRRPVGAEFDVEDVVVTAEGPVEVFGEPVTVRVADRRGRLLGSSPDELLIASLYREGHYTYDCVRTLGEYAGPSAPVLNGQALLPAPVEPGRYQIHVFRSLAWEGDPTRRLQNIREEMEVLGVGELEALAPAAPGAITLAHSALRTEETLEVRLRLPAQGSRPHDYQLEVWLSGDRFPGKVLRPPRIPDVPELTSLNTGERTVKAIAVSSPEERFEVTRLWMPGDYEVRLFDRTTATHVDRARFEVRDPGPPALPPAARYDATAITDWPTRDDPERGLDAWLPPREACEDPDFDAPPQIRLVELYSSDPERSEDDEYRPVDTVQPGHPIFVEAVFESAPPDDSYRVRVDGERRIRVERTRDPRIYRSRLLTLQPGSGPR